MSGVWSVLKKLWLKHCRCKFGKDPYNTKLWNNFATQHGSCRCKRPIRWNFLQQRDKVIPSGILYIDLSLLIVKLFLAMHIPVVMTEVCALKADQHQIKAVWKWGVRPLRCFSTSVTAG